MPIKLIEPNERSPNYRARGTHFARTSKAFYVDRSLGVTERAAAKKELRKLVDDIESGRLTPQDWEIDPAFENAAIAYVSAGGERRFLKPIAKHFFGVPLSRITQVAIDECAAALYPDAPPTTRNRQIHTPISAVLKHAGVERDVKRPKGWRGQPRLHWLSDDRMMDLIDGSYRVSNVFGAFMTFLFYCGPRLSEALRLEWADVEIERSYAFLRRTKNGEPQAAHLPPVVVSALQRLPRRGDRVFEGLTKTSRLYEKLSRAEEISAVIIPDGIAFHLTRHTYGAMMRRHVKSLVDTRRWKDEKSAAVYEHVDTSAEARRADLLPVRIQCAIREA